MQHRAVRWARASRGYAVHLVPVLLLLCVALCGASTAHAFEPEDGGYGRLEADLGLSLEAGVSEAFRSESLALRGGVSYLSSIALVSQYNESFGSDDQPLIRSVMGGVEVRPLFLARWARNMQHGPPHLDLFVDSLSLGLGLYRSWLTYERCPSPSASSDVPRPDIVTGCRDDGMELSVGFDVSLLPQANTPFIALRGALRWTMLDRSAIDDPLAPTGMLTLSFGYRHLFPIGLVDAGDRLAPR